MHFLKQLGHSEHWTHATASFGFPHNAQQDYRLNIKNNYSRSISIPAGFSMFSACHVVYFLGDYLFCFWFTTSASAFYYSRVMARRLNRHPWKKNPKNTETHLVCLPFFFHIEMETRLIMMNERTQSKLTCRWLLDTKGVGGGKPCMFSPIIQQETSVDPLSLFIVLHVDYACI